MLLVALVIVCSVLTNGEVLESIQEGIRLSPYTSYRSVALVGFNVQPRAVFSTWLFKAYSKPLGCPVQNVSVYVQQGGYPFIQPRGETIPDNFYSQRYYLYNQSFQTRGQIVAFRMMNPQPGEWFAAVFLTEKDDDIRQKGFGTSCAYFTSVSHVAPTLEDIPEVTLSTGNTTYHVTINTTNDKHLIRFLLPKGVYQYEVSVIECLVGAVDRTEISCPIRILTAGSKLPSDQGATTNCSEFMNQSCHHTETRPVPSDWNYLGIFVGNTAEYQLTLNISYKACVAVVLKPDPPPKRIHLRSVVPAPDDDSSVIMINKTLAGMESILTPPDDEHQQQCLLHPLMDQRRVDSEYFSFTYLMSAPNRHSLKTNLTNAVTIFPFEVRQAMLDGGGTLTISARIGPLKDRSQNVSVTWCASRGLLPLNGTRQLCSGGLSVSVNTSKGVGREDLHMPYPESGMWYISASRQCYVLDPDNNVTYVSCINNHTLVGLLIKSSPCVNNKCGPNGECRTFYSGVYFFTSCYCYSGYRGYLCNDGQHALADGQELLNVLLLTLSNVFFLPAAVLAMYRRYWVQGIVYLFTMCFSAIYHACDRSTKFSYCMLSYDVLSYCDFYGSILSACVTIIAMSKVNEPIRSLAMMGSCLFLAFGVAYDKHSLWVFGVPVLVLLILMLIAWGCFCRSRHSCYPPKWRYLTHLAPGACCALLGVLLFGLVETNANYPYIHSAWHALMACAVMFVLPPRSKKTKDSQESLLIGLNWGQKDEARSNEVRLFSADQPAPSGEHANELI